MALFDYFGKTLIFLSLTSGGMSVISFFSIIGTPVGIPSAGFSIVFSLTSGIIKILLKIARNKKRSIIKMLC